MAIIILVIYILIITHKTLCQWRTIEITQVMPHPINHKQAKIMTVITMINDNGTSIDNNGNAKHPSL